MDQPEGQSWTDHENHLINYPLMTGGPFPILLIMGLYLYFVKFLGPRLMKSRKPFDLSWTMRFHNITMSLVSLYGVSSVLPLTNFGLDYFGCKEVSEDHEINKEFIRLGYIYLLTKLAELLDTVFFILRKKQNQASNLHVFHHSFMLISVWTYLKLAPGGSSVLFPLLNGCVHTIMYFYYFLATFKSFRKYLWWKRHVTEAQLLQFVITMLHFSYMGISSCNYPPLLAIIGFTFNMIFFVLFCEFYQSAYLMAPTKGDREHRSVAKQERDFGGLGEVLSLYSRK